MTKSELIDALARKQSHLAYKDVELAVKSLLEAMSQSLSNGERIEIRGFGSFTSKSYDAYTGRNPRTGETIHVPAKRLPFFKVGKELKERVDYGTPTGPSPGNGAVRPALESGSARHARTDERHDDDASPRDPDRLGPY